MRTPIITPVLLSYCRQLGTVVMSRIAASHHQGKYLLHALTCSSWLDVLVLFSQRLRAAGCFTALLHLCILINVKFHKHFLFINTMENLEKTRHVEILESETMTWLVKMSREKQTSPKRYAKKGKKKNPKKLGQTCWGGKKRVVVGVETWIEVDIQRSVEVGLRVATAKHCGCVWCKWWRAGHRWASQVWVLRWAWG